MKLTIERAARTTLELLGVAGAVRGSGEGFSIAEPLDEFQRGAIETGVPFDLSLPDTPRRVMVDMQQGGGVLETGSPVLDGAQSVADQLAAIVSREGETYKPVRLLGFAGGNLGDLLQLLVGSAADGPFEKLSVRRGDLDVFELASLSSMQPRDFPPVADLKRVFQQLAALSQWRDRMEKVWREDWVSWLTRCLAEELIRRSGAPSSPNAGLVPKEVSDALSAMDTWNRPLIPDFPLLKKKNDEKLQSVLAKLLQALPNEGITAETLKKESRYGELTGKLRDLSGAFQVAAELRDQAPPVTQESLQTLTRDHLEPLLGAVRGGGAVGTVVSRYERAILAQRREYLSESGWLATLSANDDAGKYLALAPARPTNGWEPFTEAVSAACADAQLWEARS